MQTTLSSKQLLSFKIFLLNENNNNNNDDDMDIRRLSLATNACSWDDFIQQMSLLHSAYHPEMKVQYIDPEGDKCTVSCQEEWQTMLDTLCDDGAPSQQQVIKLYVSEGCHKGCYFKDGPSPQPQHFYTKEIEGGTQINIISSNAKQQEQENKENEEKSTTFKQLEISIPKCLARLFTGGRILPYNMPTWLKNCVEIKRVETTDVPVVDMDVDIVELFDVLHHKALEGIGSDKTQEELERSKNFCHCLLQIRPNHPISLYNLACVESLLGNLDEAVVALTKAVYEGGYSNVEHMCKDSDLDNIRSHSDYITLVQQMTIDNNNNNNSVETIVNKEISHQKEKEEDENDKEEDENDKEEEEEEEDDDDDDDEKKVENNEENTLIQKLAKVFNFVNNNNNGDEGDDEEFVHIPHIIKKDDNNNNNNDDEEEIKDNSLSSISETENKKDDDDNNNNDNETTPSFRYSKQLQVLVDMGFDKETSQTVLTLEKGNLKRALNSIIV